MTTGAIPAWADPVALAGRAAETVAEPWEQLIGKATLEPTDHNAGTTAPEPARRWLTHAIAPGATSARVAGVVAEGAVGARWAGGFRLCATRRDDGEKA